MQRESQQFPSSSTWRGKVKGKRTRIRKGSHHPQQVEVRGGGVSTERDDKQIYNSKHLQYHVVDREHAAADSFVLEFYYFRRKTDVTENC